jgi:hypothetical protein
MFRVKVALGAAVAVAVVTVVVFLQITSKADENVTKRVEGEVTHAQQQILRSSRLEAVDLTALAAGFAREEEVVAALSKGSEQDRRSAAYVAIETRRGRLEKDAHVVGIIGATDVSGKLIVRDRDQSFSWRNGEDLTKDYPSLAGAIQGAPNKDVWDIDGVMYRVGAAAVRDSSGKVIGALFVGDVQSARDAQAEAERSGVEVAFFFTSKGKMKIGASSFKRSEGGSSESAEERALAAQLFEGDRLAAPAIDKHEATGVFRVKINGEEWAAAAAPILGNAANSPSKSGFVTLTSVAQARAMVMPVGVLVLVLGLVGLLAAVGAAVMTARRFLTPLDKIEGGVTEVINGNRDYVFESPSEDFEGLANGLNVMLARLLGRPEPGEEDEEGGGGGADDVFVDDAAAAGGAQVASGEEAAALAAEPADAYYQRVWREYAAARQQTGEGMEGLDAETFLAKLKQNEAALSKKYGARMVRFKVVVKGNQTTLKPVPIA